ncbi:MAG: PQQ-binding-like beta-propeller repeat protein, partial [Planctomycetaceae bacterium]|nr:PQQ-binding-like beta-propeller repeat protein [Planctomycetaceae bacterium]
VVRLELTLRPAGNNGLAIRFSGKGQPHVNGLCELQVLDSEHPKYASLHPSQYHGSAYGLVPAHRGYLRPTGEWNYQQVTVRGSTIQVDLNGTRILDTDLSQVAKSKDGKLHEAIAARKGYFGFAGHNDPVAFRNIRIKRLPTQPVSETVTQWPQFRGNGGRGVAEWNTGLPTDIGPDKKAAWKIPLPPGHSSPVIFGDHIFLAAEDNDQLFTMALDRSTGKVLWKQEAKYNKLESIHSIGSHVQTTPATDGKHVVSLFGSTGMFCYDLAGKLLWNKPMGPFNNSFGAGSSPLIVDGQVILCQDHDTGSFLESIDVTTGKTTWKIDRSEFPRNYGTPVIWEVNGHKQIVVAATLRVVGYDFRSGEELWTVRGVSRVVCTTPVIGEDNHLYVASWARGGDIDERISVDPFKTVLAKVDANNNGTIERDELEKGGPVQRRYEQVDRDKTKTLTEKEWEYYRGVFDAARNGVLKIRPGGTGDISKSHVEWEFRKFLPFCSSPLVYNGYVFTVKDGGIVTCLDA